MCRKFPNSLEDATVLIAYNVPSYVVAGLGRKLVCSVSQDQLQEIEPSEVNAVCSAIASTIEVHLLEGGFSDLTETRMVRFRRKWVRSESPYSRTILIGLAHDYSFIDGQLLARIAQIISEYNLWRARIIVHNSEHSQHILFYPGQIVFGAEVVTSRLDERVSEWKRTLDVTRQEFRVKCAHRLDCVEAYSVEYARKRTQCNAPLMTKLWANKALEEEEEFLNSMLETEDAWYALFVAAERFGDSFVDLAYFPGVELLESYCVRPDGVIDRALTGSEGRIDQGWFVLRHYLVKQDLLRSEIDIVANGIQTDMTFVVDIP